MRWRLHLRSDPELEYYGGSRLTVLLEPDGLGGTDLALHDTEVADAGLALPAAGWHEYARRGWSRDQVPRSTHDPVSAVDPAEPYRKRA